MGGPASEARRGDGAKQKSVRKSCRSAGDPAWKTMRQHRVAAWGVVNGSGKWKWKMEVVNESGKWKWEMGSVIGSKKKNGTNE